MYNVQEGYLAPVYAAVGPGAPSYLYSHHPTGKVTLIPSIHNMVKCYIGSKKFQKELVFRCFHVQVWTIGSSETSWSLRLNKLTSPEEQRTCPLDTPEDK